MSQPTIHVYPQWQLQAAEENIDLNQLMAIFTAVEKVGNLSAAAKLCALSYRHVWGLVRKAEQAFDVLLIETSRRKGSKLTEFASQMLYKYHALNDEAHTELKKLEQAFSQGLNELYAGEHLVLRLYASHGFAVEGLLQHNTRSDYKAALELHYRTGSEALAYLLKGECDIAGFQIPTGQYQAAALEHYSQYFRSNEILLIFLAKRNVGLFVQKGNPLGIHDIAQLIQPKVRVVNRQPGSGSRYLMRLMLERQSVDADLVLNYGATEFTHMAVAAHIASGMADVGFGIETAAWRCGLDFISLGAERYFFAFHRNRVNSEAIQDFLSLVRSVDYKQYIQDLAGYDSEGMGLLYTPQQAFGKKFNT